jgi:hypothetical protein
MTREFVNEILTLCDYEVPDDLKQIKEGLVDHKTCYAAHKNKPTLDLL